MYAWKFLPADARLPTMQCQLGPYFLSKKSLRCFDILYSIFRCSTEYFACVTRAYFSDGVVLHVQLIVHVKGRLFLVLHPSVLFLIIASLLRALLCIVIIRMTDLSDIPYSRRTNGESRPPSRRHRVRQHLEREEVQQRNLPVEARRLARKRAGAEQAVATVAEQNPEQESSPEGVGPDAGRAGQGDPQERARGRVPLAAHHRGASAANKEARDHY